MEIVDRIAAEARKALADPALALSAMNWHPKSAVVL
jgi:hypothetical protein